MSQIRWNRAALTNAAGQTARRVGLYVEAAAKRAVPVDTGHLSRSLTMVESGDDTVIVGTGVNYAAYVEYGARGRPAQPYLKPALAAARAKYGGRLG